jgi:putative oxidoreductase
MNIFASTLKQGLPFSFVLLRIVIAWRLIAGTWPYILGSKSIAEVIAFFQSLNKPLPGISAYVSLYAQFGCGILLVVGWLTRPAALVLTINFSVALLAAHLHDPIESSFQAWALWAISMYFFFHGGGSISIDSFRNDLTKLNQIKSWESRDGF